MTKNNSSINKSRKHSCISTVFNFPLSTFFGTVFILILIFIPLIKHNLPFTYLTASLTLFVTFFKIEWDKNNDEIKRKKEEKQEKDKAKMNNRRILLAYYHELKTIQIEFQNSKYKKTVYDTDIETIDDYVKKNDNCSSFAPQILYETERANKNIQIAKDRHAIHHKLLNIIQKMLLDSDITIDTDLYNQFKDLQTKSFTLEKINLNELGNNLDNDYQVASYHQGDINSHKWKRIIFPHLKELDTYIFTDESFIQEKFDNLVITIEEINNH